MHPSPSLLAVVGQPLFGNPWLALLAMLGLVAVFLFAVAGLGRWLAATHPDGPAVRKPAPALLPSSAATDLTPDTLAVIAASVAATFGTKARIAAVELAKPQGPSVEALMVQWSLEGRRQIYSSHKVR